MRERTQHTVVCAVVVSVYSSVTNMQSNKVQDKKVRVVNMGDMMETRVHACSPTALQKNGLGFFNGSSAQYYYYHSAIRGRSL